MAVNWSLAGLGAASGIASAAIGLAGGEHMLDLLHVAPGLAFGAIVGAGLWRAGRLRPAGWALYAAAAAGANALAVVVALRAIEPATRLAGDGLLVLAAIGVLAGAVGGVLLGLATSWLSGSWLAGAGQRLRGLLAGGVLGAALPLLIDGETAGALAFYALWQGGYAAFASPPAP